VPAPAAAAARLGAASGAATPFAGRSYAVPFAGWGVRAAPGGPPQPSPAGAPGVPVSSSYRQSSFAAPSAQVRFALVLSGHAASLTPY